MANEKKVIIIPNIDSYETFDTDQDWFANLKTLSAHPNFQIWSKTKQIYDWIHDLGVKNNRYLNFMFYRPKLKLNASFIDKENNEDVVLIDASNLGETIKEDGNQKTVLTHEEEEHIIKTFTTKEVIEDFSVVVCLNLLCLIVLLLTRFSFKFSKFLSFRHPVVQSREGDFLRVPKT